MTTDPSFTVGIEEEYFIVDRETRDLVRDMPDGLIEACEEIAEGMVSPEFMRSQIEVGTPVSKAVNNPAYDDENLILKLSNEFFN